MRIAEAIKLARKKNKRIKSEICNAYLQDAKSLIHWLLVDDSENPRRQVHLMLDFLEADDWELDNEE